MYLIFEYYDWDLLAITEHSQPTDPPTIRSLIIKILRFKIPTTTFSILSAIVRAVRASSLFTNTIEATYNMLSQDIIILKICL